MKSVDAGSAVVAGPGGDELLLVWKKPGEVKLPAGKYKLRTTRVERTHKEEHWFLSSTGPAGKPFTIKRGKGSIDLGGTVHFAAQVRGWRGAQLVLGFMISNGEHRGVSVYRQDKRVPVTFKVLDRKGKILKAGRMNYG